MVGSSTETSELAAGEGEQLSNGFVWDKSSAAVLPPWIPSSELTSPTRTILLERLSFHQETRVQHGAHRVISRSIQNRKQNQRSDSPTKEGKFKQKDFVPNRFCCVDGISDCFVYRCGGVQQIVAGKKIFLQTYQQKSQHQKEQHRRKSEGKAAGKDCPCKRCSG